MHQSLYKLHSRNTPTNMRWLRLHMWCVLLCACRKKKLGSVSDEITKHALCNTLVIKVGGRYWDGGLALHVSASSSVHTVCGCLLPTATVRRSRQQQLSATRSHNMDAQLMFAIKVGRPLYPVAFSLPAL
jgi:hypothetical protein